MRWWALLILLIAGCAKSPPEKYHRGCERSIVRDKLSGSWQATVGSQPTRISFFIVSAGDTSFIIFQEGDRIATQRTIPVLLNKEPDENEQKCLWVLVIPDYGYWIIHDLTDEELEVDGEPELLNGRYHRID